MITATFTDEGQYSPPMLVAPELRAVIEMIAAGAPLDCTISIQYLLSSPDSEPSQPSDADSGWTLIETFEGNAAPHVYVSTFGGAWFRVAILTGGYVEGEAGVKLSISKAA